MQLSHTMAASLSPSHSYTPVSHTNRNHTGKGILGSVVQSTQAYTLSKASRSSSGLEPGLTGVMSRIPRLAALAHDRAGGRTKKHSGVKVCRVTQMGQGPVMETEAWLDTAFSLHLPPSHSTWTTSCHLSNLAGRCCCLLLSWGLIHFTIQLWKRRQSC